jgi:hypothetical protein
MVRRHSNLSRAEAAKAVFDIDKFWAQSFPESELRDLNLCDLLTQLWLIRDAAVPKSEVYAFMPNISRRTAVKYVQLAIDQGMLLENVHESDRRVRLISLSRECAARVETFLDFTCERFRGRT